MSHSSVKQNRRAASASRRGTPQTSRVGGHHKGKSKERLAATLLSHIITARHRTHLEVLSSRICASENECVSLAHFAIAAFADSISFSKGFSATSKFCGGVGGKLVTSVRKLLISPNKRENI